jgi:hypothetical protein
MSLPTPIARLWDELERARVDVLREVEGLSQPQSEWKPRPGEWSIGEILDHLTVAEVSTGKLTTRLLKEVQAGSAAAVFPHDLAEFGAVPAAPPGRVEAPPGVWPGHGKPIGELIAAMKAARVRSRESIERLAGCDPRRLRFTHVLLGDMDLGQWWRLQAWHDTSHLQQLREVKAAPGFPA